RRTNSRFRQKKIAANPATPSAPHHTTGLPSSMMDRDSPAGCISRHIAIGCFMIGHVYHLDDAECVASMSDRLPRAMAAWTSAIFEKNDRGASGEYSGA